MDRQPAVYRERAPELLDEAGREVATDQRLREGRVVVEKWPTGAVDNDPRQRLIEGRMGRAVPLDAVAISQRFAKRLTEDDADILDGVVGVDVMVSSCFHHESNPAMPGEGVQHVIEERDAGGDVHGGGVVEVYCQRDVGLAGLACDRGGSCRHV